MAQQLVVDRPTHRNRKSKMYPETQGLLLFYQHARADHTPFYGVY